MLAGSAHPGDGTTAIQQGGAELVFVDARVPDVQQLLDDLAAQQQAGRPIEVVVVGSDEDGIGVIGAALAGRSDVSADDWQVIEGAQADRWKITPNSKYRKLTIKDGPYILTVRNRLDVEAVCHRHDLFDEC